MTRKVILFGLGIILLAASAFAGLVDSKKVTGPTRILGMASDPAITAPAVEARVPQDGSLDMIGTNYQAGTTWYDYQHNGTAGKMIGTDDFGYVHLVWMKGLDQANANRHVYYNIFDPSTSTFLFPGGGQQVDNSTRAGYTAQATMNTGFCFPAFHAFPQDDLPDSLIATTAIDFLGGSGAFTSSHPLRPGTQAAIWPKIALGQDSVLHMVSTSSVSPQGVYYSRGTATFDAGFGLEVIWDTFDSGEQMELLGDGETISADVATSSVSNRVAVAWNHSRGGEAGIGQINNDLILKISEDGGLNWGPDIDVTQWIPPDVNCASGDTMLCNGDTLRPYTDMSLLFDNEGQLHIAFTTRTLYEVGHTSPDGGPGPIGWIDQSGIWHWSEEYQEYSPIVSDYHFNYVDDALVSVGAWQLNVHRPNLAIDPVTGNIFCSFMRYDSTQYSENFFLMADAWVSVSCNEGRMWAEATNVTETIGGEGVPAGQSTSERDITVAKNVTYTDGVGYLHMEYVFDLDAGGLPQSEGVATNCPVYYHRIPVDSIPLTPYVDPFHKVMHIDSMGMPGSVVPLDLENPCVSAIGDDNDALTPRSFALHQNYPNPFNPSTKIQFDLNRAGNVTLSIFNLLGQEAVRLIDGKNLNAGVHVSEFDATGLSSGVYMYRLNVDGSTATRKMVLMK